MKNILLFLLIVCIEQVNGQYFNPPTLEFATGTGPSLIITADFNGDAKLDLVTANTGSNNVSVLLGTGTGTFGAAVNFAVGTGPFGVVSGYFNADGNLDLAVCNAGTNNVSVLLGNGAGGFGTATNFAVAVNPRAIATGNFNGDANLDLAVCNQSSNNISILLGTGTGSFGASTNFVTGTAPRSIISGNFNGDANLDLAVANITSNNVSVLLGTGTGSFGAATNFVVGTNPRSITIADFNGDLIKDLVTANSGSNNVSVLLGTGTGTFGLATNFAVGTTPYSVTTADFNTDGNVDLGVANFSSTNVSNFQSVSVLMGTGTGSFGAVLTFMSTMWTVPANPSTLISGDFNSDTKPDLAIANSAFNSVNVLKSFIPTVGTCSAPMRIVILGASSSFGMNATTFDSAYAYRFRQFIIDSVNGYSEIINLAHAGYTTYAMQPTGYPVPNPYVVDTLRNVTKAISLNPDGVIFNFTCNDVNGLIPLDTTIKNLLRSTGMLTALGIPFWITTTQPCSFIGDPNQALKKQMLLDLRDSMILHFSTNYIESYVGFAQTNGNLLPVYSSSDSTHFNNAGHRKLFDNVQSKGIPDIICPMVTGTLPIELISFYGKASSEKNILYWTTASELNNNYFTLLKSPNRKNFEVIAKINGAGNSTQTLNYSFIDTHPFAGINYYVLQQTDYNGQIAFSKIIAVNNSSEKINPIIVSPNPANEEINISGIDFNAGNEIQIMSTLGKILFQNKIKQPASVFKLQTLNFPKGIYFIRVTDSNNFYSNKFIKE